MLAATCETLDTTWDFRAVTWNNRMKTFRIWRTLNQSAQICQDHPEGLVISWGFTCVCSPHISPRGYFHFKISRDTIHLLGESPGCGRCPSPWQGGGMRRAWSSLPSQTLLGWSYHSHTLSLYLHIQHYIIDHNLQWQRDATVKVITLDWEHCLASFNLCHLPERQSNECTQKSLHKIIQQEL